MSILKITKSLTKKYTLWLGVGRHMTKVKVAVIVSNWNKQSKNKIRENSKIRR